MWGALNTFRIMNQILMFSEARNRRWITLPGLELASHIFKLRGVVKHCKCKFKYTSGKMLIASTKKHDGGEE